MNSDFIDDEEQLFRCIKNIPNWWKSKFNRPSSAAFKDSKGVSVDRSGGRTNEAVVKEYKRKFDLKAVVSVTAGRCRELNTYPVPKPTRKNSHHAEIHDSPYKVQLSGGKARELSKAVKIDYLNE